MKIQLANNEDDFLVIWVLPVFLQDYIPVDQEELRDYVKARLKVFYEEELDVPLVLFNEVLDHVLRIDRWAFCCDRSPLALAALNVVLGDPARPPDRPTFPHLASTLVLSPLPLPFSVQLLCHIRACCLALTVLLPAVCANRDRKLR